MQEAQKLFQELIKDYIRIGIPLPVSKIRKELEYSNSLTALGKCRHLSNEYIIYLSRNAMRDTNQIRNTLAHELIHTLPGCMNHGKKFHTYCALVYEKLGISIDTRATNAEAENSGIREAYVKNANYKIVCSQCEYTLYRQKRSKLISHSSRYRCGRCGGKLIVWQKNK